MRALLMALGISVCSFLVGVAGDLSGPSPVLAAQATAGHSVIVALPPLRPEAFATATAAARERPAPARRTPAIQAAATPALAVRRHELVTLVKPAAVKPALPLKLIAAQMPAKERLAQTPAKDLPLAA